MLTVWCLRLYASPRPRSSLRSLRLSMHREAPGPVHVQPSGRRVDYPHCSELQPTLLSEFPVFSPALREGRGSGGWGGDALQAHVEVCTESRLCGFRKWAGFLSPNPGLIRSSAIQFPHAIILPVSQTALALSHSSVCIHGSARLPTLVNAVAEGE